MKELLHRPAPEAARVVALELLSKAEAARARLRDPDDVEALHDFRVALRRLRSWERAFRELLQDTLGRKARRRLGRVAEATNEARDLEVLEELLGKLPLRTPELRAARRALDDSLRARVKDAEADASEAGAKFDAVRGDLRRGLSSWLAPISRDSRPEALATAVARLARAQARELRMALAGADSPERQDEAHEARIAGKRLRYLLEPFGQDDASARAAVAQLKELQDRLGDMHDLAVLRQRASDLAADLAASAAEGGDGESESELESDSGSGSGSESESESRSESGPEALARRAAGLRSLAARVDARIVRAHRELVGAAQVRARERLFARVESVARRLEALGSSGLEHERKYLLSSMPPRALRGRRSRIEQGWIPGAAIVERLRRERTGSLTRYFRTIKSGRGVSRLEAEESVRPALFRKLWPLTEGRRVVKDRFVVRAGGAAWEIDRVLARDLVLAEIEMPAAGDDVPIPRWLAPHVVREVTGEDEYVNRNLAR